MQKYLTTILILLSLMTFAEPMQEKEIQFKPYMVNHLNEGCPVGSECSEKNMEKKEKNLIKA